MAGRRLQRLPGTRVEPAPNSEYAPISEMRLCNNARVRYLVSRSHTYLDNGAGPNVGAMYERDPGIS